MTNIATLPASCQASFDADFDGFPDFPPVDIVADFEDLPDDDLPDDDLQARLGKVPGDIRHILLWTPEELKSDNLKYWARLAVEAAIDDGVPALIEVCRECEKDYPRTGKAGETAKAKRDARGMANHIKHLGIYVLDRSEGTPDRDGLAVILLELGYDIRDNIRTGYLEFRRKRLWNPTRALKRYDGPETEWQPCGSDFEDSLREEIARSYFDNTPGAGRCKPLRWTDSLWRNSFRALMYREKVDPFREWLEFHDGYGYRWGWRETTRKPVGKPV